MYSTLNRFYFAVTTMMLLFLFSTNVFSAEQKEANEKGKITTFELRISNDGKSIIDQNGQVVARFVEGIKVISSKKNIEKKLPGCMKTEKECIAYENGKCVKWITTSTWDFDCVCK